MKSIWRILKLCRPYTGYAVLNIFFNLLMSLFFLGSFTLFIPVLQMLFKTVPAVTTPPESLNLLDIDSIKDNFYYIIGSQISKYGEVEVLIGICVIIIVVFLLKNLFRFLAMFFLAVVRIGVVRDFRNNLYEKITILPLGYYSEQRKGDILARISSDVLEVEHSVMSSLEMIFRDPIQIITYVITLFAISYELSLFVLILLPLSGLIIGRIGRSLKKTSQKGQAKFGFLISVVEETVSGLRIVKAKNAITFANKRFREINQDYAKLMIKLYRKRDLASPLSEFLGIVVTVVVLWFGGRLVLSQESTLDAALFLVYIGIFTQLIPPAKAVTQAYYNIQKGAASIERIDKVLNEPEVIEEKPDAIRKHDFTDAIEYRNVSFRYEKEFVLKHINLRIEKGRTVAVVGASGSGKSTLADMLPRFYDTTDGEILIDGISIKDLNITDLRGLMGIVSQEAILFNDTVFNNIAFGLENVSEEDVVHAARVANAHEFIEQMSRGYYTIIGDRGIKMSGGQRQRLCIARAVLRNPPILILDEATSSLDTESERLVQSALENLMKNRTSIVIAHRLSTIRYADEIMVMHHGEIVERGTHNHLLSLNGVYKKLHDLQSIDSPVSAKNHEA